MFRHHGAVSPDIAAQPVADFWQDGYMADAQPFTGQLADLDRFPRGRVLTSHYSNEDRSATIVRTFTEAKGMRDLRTYIDEVGNLVSGLDDPNAANAAGFLNDMDRRFTFLGTPEYALACKGIANSWEAYLRMYPDSAINVVNMRYDTIGRRNTDRLRSYDQVPFDVIGNLDKSVSDRVLHEPLDWRFDPNSILVGVDDWILSGNVVDSITRQAQSDLERIGKKEELDKLEIHLLIANANRIGKRNLIVSSVGNYAIDGTVRSYFRAPESERSPWNGYGTFFSGAHSSADYDFNVALGKISELMEQHGLPRRMPLLTYINPAYRIDERTLQK